MLYLSVSQTVSLESIYNSALPELTQLIWKRVVVVFFFLLLSVFLSQLLFSSSFPLLLSLGSVAFTL